jgi:Tol biopolymer transport system component
VTQTGLQDYPALSSDGTRLAYSSSQTVALARAGVQVIQQLWVMNLETGNAGQLLLSNAQDIQPNWSPSGDEIAFASNRSGQFEIWTMDADGSNVRQITKGDGAKTWPDWSPDGQSIMFTNTEGGRYSVWIIDKDGENLRPFKPFGANDLRQIREAAWD